VASRNGLGEGGQVWLLRLIDQDPRDVLYERSLLRKFCAILNSSRKKRHEYINQYLGRPRRTNVKTALLHSRFSQRRNHSSRHSKIPTLLRQLNCTRRILRTSAGSRRPRGVIRGNRRQEKRGRGRRGRGRRGDEESPAAAVRARVICDRRRVSASAASSSSSSRAADVAAVRVRDRAI